jgi:hypothetical protein
MTKFEIYIFSAFMSLTTTHYSIAAGSNSPIGRQPGFSYDSSSVKPGFGCGIKKYRIMKSAFVLVLSFFGLTRICGQENQDASGTNSKNKISFRGEAALIYENNLNSALINSSGIGSRSTVLLISKHRIKFGLVADWRLIPGLFNRKFDQNLKNRIYPSLITYSGSDSLSWTQLGNVLNKETIRTFYGFTKLGVGLVVNYDINLNSSLRVNLGLISKQFRTEGNDTFTNPYGEPGKYWLNTGLGYSTRLEYHLRLGKYKVFGHARFTKLLIGISSETFKFSNLKYNDLSISESLGIPYNRSQDIIRIYNIYLGISFSKKE